MQVPVVLVAAHLVPGRHTLLFVLSVLAIVPPAGLPSHATESVADRTGDIVGGLLDATLGNLNSRDDTARGLLPAPGDDA